MARVLLIRHGETHGYYDDVGLTEHGEEQVRAKGDELAGELPAGARVAFVHAPTARATATARGLRDVLAARRDDLALGVPGVDAHFDSVQFLHDGAASESSGVAAHRLRYESNGAGVADWVRAYDRFDTDYGAGSRLGGPIDRWMDLVSLHFEPPQVIAYRAWAGIRALGPDAEVTLVSSHSALLRGFAAAALGHDPGEPRNLEHVEVVVPDGGVTTGGAGAGGNGRRAGVAFRGERVDVGVPTELPPWLDPAYFAAGERAAHRW